MRVRNAAAMLLMFGGFVALATPAGGQAAPAPKPVQFAGAGFTSLSSSGGSNSGLSLFYGAAFSKIYLNIASNIFSTAGTTTVINDYQVGYLLKLQPDPAKGRMGIAVTGGIWKPEGGTFGLVALNGFAGPPNSHLAGHLMGGYILPKSGGEGSLLFRVGAAWIF